MTTDPLDGMDWPRDYEEIQDYWFSNAYNTQEDDSVRP